MGFLSWLLGGKPAKATNTQATQGSRADSLGRWWRSEVSPPEKRVIRQNFDPLGGSAGRTIERLASGDTSRPANTLSGMASHMKGAKKYAVAEKLARRAVFEGHRDDDPKELHFALQQLIEVYYKQRSDPAKLRSAEDACQQQIEIAPDVAKAMQGEYGDDLPTHRGFEQLAIICKKTNRPERGIEICEEAALQGWRGGWESRISRFKKQLAKQRREEGEKAMEEGRSEEALQLFRAALDLDEKVGVKRKTKKLEKQLASN